MTNENDYIQPEKSSNESHESSIELQEMNNDKQARDKAWELYRGYDEAYERANQERAATGRIAVERFPQATLVAQIRVDEQGKAISGHDYDPQAQSHLDTEAQFDKYLASTPEEERFVIYEGSDASYTDRHKAISERADAGLAMMLADGAGVERASGEPTPPEELRALIDAGVDADEAAMYLTLRSLGSSLIKNPEKASDIGPEVYAQLAIIGQSGFKEYSKAEKAEIIKDPKLRDTLLEGMSADGAKFATERFNPRLAELGLPQFEASDDGKLTWPVDATDIVARTGGPASGRMGEIGKINGDFRDRHIFDTIADAVQDGKKPFVVYGGSHIVALKPALDAYFGNRPA